MIEVLSPGQTNRDRDLVTKRADYARARIPEYWIVDQEQSMVTVLTLSETDYVIHGQFSRGTSATSVYLPEFTVDVAELFLSACGNKDASTPN